jgi:RNA polymerase-binding transcription factor DksA
MLTPKQLETLRAALVKQLADLRLQLRSALAAETNERFRDIAGEVVDLGDEAIGAEISGTDNALIGRHVQEVRDIEAALARITDAKYGAFLDCGGDVDYGRLSAYPTCTRCARCQAVHEKTFAGEPHPTL